MEQLELQPTQDNLFKTFAGDSIERNKDLSRFVNMLNSIEGNCSIALDGAWGCGKTFFVKQTKMILEAYNNFTDFPDETRKHTIKKIFEDYLPKDAEPTPIRPQVSIYYDAWSNDNDVDPILSLVYEMLHNVSMVYPFNKGLDCLKIAAGVAEFITGKKVSALLDAFKQEDSLSAIKNQKDIQENITEFLNALIAENGDRLVIFVDELDRCKPSYAVQLLERIKHYFSSDQITFVFSINASELQHTVKQYYGADYDSYNYLDRFFDIKMSLPPVDINRYLKFIMFNQHNYTYEMVVEKVIKQYHFEMREVTRFVRLAKIAYNPAHELRSIDGSIEFCLLSIVPIMIGLKISDAVRFWDFVNGKDESPLLEIWGQNDEHISICERLLGNNEIYYNNSTNSTLKVVSIEDKLKSVYDALFIESYNNNDVKSKRVGGIVFYKSTRDRIIRVVGLLSDFSDYSMY